MSKKHRFNGQQRASTIPMNGADHAVEIPEVASEIEESTVEDVMLNHAGIQLDVPFDIQEMVGYCQQHFTFHIDLRQALTLNILRKSLADRAERFHVGGAYHEDGRVVEKGVDALRWLLDQIADAAGLPE